MKKIFFLLLCCICTNALCLAQHLYGLDPTFANNGIYIGDTGGYGRIVVQPDKKIVVTGYEIINGTYIYVVKRFNENGTIDLSFANNGYFRPDILALNNISVLPIYLQPDGKILLGGAGNNNFLLIRLNANDGSLDSSFGDNGANVLGLAGSEMIRSIALQTDGKIVVCGEKHYDNAILVVRYNSNGSLDSSFGTNGMVSSDWRNWGIERSSPNDIAIMPDGRIIVGAEARISSLNPPWGAYAFTAIRLLSDGSLDTSFNHTGIAYTNTNLPGLLYCTTMQLQQDNKILLGGHADSIAVVRFDTAGKLDISFGINGLVKLDPAGKVMSMLLESDGKIVVGTNPDGFPYPDTSFTIYRILPNGSIDSSFGINGKVLTKPLPSPVMLWTVALQTDSKLIASTSNLSVSTPYKLMIIRYTPNATFVYTNDLQEKITLYPNPTVDYLYIDNATTQRLSTIMLYSTDGKLLRTQTHPGTNRLSTEGLADGIYYLHIRFTNHTTLVRKIIIQKH